MAATIPDAASPSLLPPDPRRDDRGKSRGTGAPDDQRMLSDGDQDHTTLLLDAASSGGAPEARAGDASACASAERDDVHHDDVRHEARRAIATVLPLLVGFVPFGLVVGVRVGEGDVFAARWLSSVLILGGSAQLAVLELVDSGAPVAVILATGLLINVRLIAYSISLAPEWVGASRTYRAIAAASVIDPTWALAQQRIRDGGSVRARRLYYAFAAGLLSTGWIAIITVGAFVGVAGFDAAETAIPLCLIALVMPHLTSRTERGPMAAAAVVVWFAADLTAGVGVLLAAGAAVAVGSWTDRRREADGFDHGEVT